MPVERVRRTDHADISGLAPQASSSIALFAPAAPARTGGRGRRSSLKVKIKDLHALIGAGARERYDPGSVTLPGLSQGPFSVASVWERQHCVRAVQRALLRHSVNSALRRAHLFSARRAPSPRLASSLSGSKLRVHVCSSATSR